MLNTTGARQLSHDNPPTLNRHLPARQSHRSIPRNVAHAKSLEGKASRLRAARTSSTSAAPANGVGMGRGPLELHTSRMAASSSRAACIVSRVDRLVHNAEVIAIDGDFYRLKEVKERAKQRARQRRAQSS